jgi:hypothetical protein
MLAKSRTDVEFHLVQSRLELLKGASGASQLDERPHDLDVHCDGSVAAEHP